MRGIKDMVGFCMWVNNERAEWMASLLDNQRPVSPEKRGLLKQIEASGKPKPVRRLSAGPSPAYKGRPGIIR